ncbi:hypothetical protein WLV04_25060 [Bordetella bronchiseptica]|uniref:Uncharacterized protein n=1 Tax=Bordetella bronchiseptica 00-P-2796 TaxID=1331199 RepID=A0ABR4RDM3_BORBO|nr:hypothetical protein [Bordetella bronchiseptica]KAK74686.1 hypothetical protein L530_3445 [Bordetella bronchiseptica MO211]KCV34119.1 hypothetical protein L490_3353 [Bordetella bronchiseptica 00-P-2796]KDB85281.1 hypothetical protein L495_3622 [Bordetella bronchiseptica CARE970018BB]KDC19037.1 hypothetical protein L542_3658 [Bordetella bronchiseptica F-1]KDC26294.1 hypothetical protein L504_3680 [Bordetella bronchiseptica F2]
MDIKQLSDSARKVHGADINFQVVRSVAWGNTDNCILVKGRNHSKAAADLSMCASRVGYRSKVEEQTSAGFQGSPSRVCSAVSFA